MGCFVQGDKYCMGCFVRGGKSMRDVLCQKMAWDVLSRDVFFYIRQDNVYHFLKSCIILFKKHNILRLNM